jgi:hypothetical protein
MTSYIRREEINTMINTERQNVDEWMHKCPTDAEIMHEFDDFYVIHIKKYKEDLDD